MTIKGMVISAMFFGCRVSGEKNGIFDERLKLVSTFILPYVMSFSVHFEAQCVNTFEKFRKLCLTILNDRPALRIVSSDAADCTAH